jgi:predicted dehydrogenase
MVWEGSYEVDVRGAALLASNQGSHGLLEWGFGQAYRNEIEVWGESGSLIATRAFSKTATLETTIRLVMQSGEESEERIEPADHFANMLERFGQVVLDASWQELMAGAASQSSLVEAVRVASVGS